MEKLFHGVVIVMVSVVLIYMEILILQCILMLKIKLNLSQFVVGFEPVFLWMKKDYFTSVGKVEFIMEKTIF